MEYAPGIEVRDGVRVDNPDKRVVTRSVGCYIGSVVEIGRDVYRCVERGEVLCPADACLGCDLAQRWCDNVACSSFDRPDGKNVWYKKL